MSLGQGQGTLLSAGCFAIATFRVTWCAFMLCSLQVGCNRRHWYRPLLHVWWQQAPRPARPSRCAIRQPLQQVASCSRGAICIQLAAHWVCDKAPAAKHVLCAEPLGTPCASTQPCRPGTTRCECPAILQLSKAQPPPTHYALLPSPAAAVPVPPREQLSKESYMADGHKATTINHFYEKLLKIKVRAQPAALPHCGPRKQTLGARMAGRGWVW